MSSRVVGAVLAFAAVALFALSMFGGAWWSGHPTVDGRAIERKDVHIGLLGGSGCNNGGESRDCSALPLSSAVTTAGIVELVTSGLAAVGAVVLALAILRREERRKKLGKLVLGAVGLSAGLALVLAVLGPGVQAAQHVSVPFGFGMLAFWLATAGAIAASMLAQREFPPAITAQMRMPAPHLLPPPTAPVQQQVDVLALLQDDSLRPAELGPEPMIGRPPQSPGGSLPGYSGPLGAPSAGGAPAGSPLFSSAPQLRPLYEMNGGSAPLTAPPPRFPPRAPTPIPRASFRPPTSPPPVPPAPRPRTMPPPAARAKPGSPSKQTPAPHTPPPETPPPSVGRPATIASLVVPPPMVPAPPIVPERIVSARRAETDPAERAETQAREDETKERVKTEHQDETNERVKEAADDDREYQTAVELVGRPERADSESYPVGDSTSPNLDLATAEESALGDEGPTDRSRDSSADVETIALEKISMSELDAPDATSPAMHAVEEDRERPETERPDTKTERPETVTGVIDMERREERATSEASKMPVSTASESLPPPVEQPQATGPSPACPQCEAPMRWVEEHLRFYCKSCRMYF